MLRKFVSLVIVLNLLVCSYASSTENDSKLNSKNDAESSGKSFVDSRKDDKNRYAAPLNELENARTHFSLKPGLFGGLSQKLPFGFGGGYPHQQGHQPIISQIPFLKPFLRPVQPPQIAPAPIIAPSKPYFPQIFSPPFISKPHLPVVSKPTFVVSQQVIHKPVVTEKIEIIRRPVISEVVEVVHKPILSEVQQVIKHPTYVEHVVKKPLVTAIKNEFTGSPVHLPSQHYELHNKPEHIQPVTTEVIQIPHQQVPVTGSVGLGSSYGFESGYKPSYSISSPAVTGSYGSGYGSSYGLGSTYGSSYGLGSGYGSSYGLGSGYGSSYGLGSGSGSSYGLGSGYGSSYGLGSGYGSSYGLGSGSGSSYGVGSGYGSSYGSSYVKPTYGEESTGVEHTYVEPAVSCKNDECRPINSEEELALNENLQPMYSPLWYYGPSRVEGREFYGRTNGEDYEQGLPGSPGYYYLVPQMQPYEQSLEEPQDSKLADFLNHPSTKLELEALYDKYRKTNANTRTDERKLAKGKSNDDDDDTRVNMGEEKDKQMMKMAEEEKDKQMMKMAEEEKDKQMMKMTEEEKVEQIMKTVKTASGSMLKKIEEKVRDRQNELENSIPKSENTGTPIQDSTPTLTHKGI